MWKTIVIVVGVVLCACLVIVAVVVACCELASRGRRSRRRSPTTRGRQSGFEKKGTTITRGGGRRNDSRGRNRDDVSATETARIYPIAGADAVQPALFLATSSPRPNPLEEKKGRGQGRGQGRRARKTQAANRHDHNIDLVATSCIGGETEYEETTFFQVVGIPVDFPPPQPPPLPPTKPPLSSLPDQRVLGSRKRSRNEEDGKVKQYRHRSRSHGGKSTQQQQQPPPPTSTFEEDLLMLERQNEVAESGVASTRTTSETLDSPRQRLSCPASAHQHQHRIRRNRRDDEGGGGSRHNSGGAIEAIPLHSYDGGGGRSKKMMRRTHSTTPVDSGKRRGVKGVAVGHRPPVEGSHDPETDLALGHPPNNQHFKSPSKTTTPLAKTEKTKLILPKSSHGFRTDADLSSSQPNKGIISPTAVPQDCPTGGGQVLRSDPVGHDGRNQRDPNRSFNSSNTYVSMKNLPDPGPTRVN